VVRTVIVANAPWSWSTAQVARVLAAELVVAADGGANHLARIGVRPAAVVGDLDSVTTSVRSWVGDARLVHRPDQDHTDLHKTITYCFEERGATEITVLAATGGRLDHTMENLGLLARFAARGPLAFVAGEQRIVAVSDELWAPSLPGDTVSLMPLGRCGAVWTSGLEWELDGEPLDLASRSSVSNRAVGRSIRVRVAGGVLLAFLPDPVPGC
jgi:thiamine pyrophosphokinase